MKTKLERERQVEIDQFDEQLSTLSKKLADSLDASDKLDNEIEKQAYLAAIGNADAEEKLKTARSKYGELSVTTADTRAALRVTTAKLSAARDGLRSAEREHRVAKLGEFKSAWLKESKAVQRLVDELGEALRRSERAKFTLIAAAGSGASKYGRKSGAAIYINKVLNDIFPFHFRRPMSELERVSITDADNEIAEAIFNVAEGGPKPTVTAQPARVRETLSGREKAPLTVPAAGWGHTKNELPTAAPNRRSVEAKGEFELLQELGAKKVGVK